MGYQGSCEPVRIVMLVLTIAEMREHLPVVGLGSMRFDVIAALSALIAAAWPWAHAQESGGGAHIRSLEQVTLERGGCYGSCPVYRITIFSDGRVAYWGEQNVKSKGARSKTLDAAALRELKDELNRAGYFGLRDRYDSKEAGCTSLATDAPSAQTSVRADGRIKSVEHYLGCGGPASDRLVKLEDTIDRIAGTAGWIGTPKERERQQRKERAQACAAQRPVAGNSSAIAIPADFERGRTGQEITRFYRQAARSGNCAAMRRLSEIYGKGIPGVSRDLQESLAWKADADCCGASPR